MYNRDEYGLGGRGATLDNDQSHSSGNFYRSIMLLWWLYEADSFGYLVLQLRQVCRKECMWRTTMCWRIESPNKIRIENDTETGVSADRDDLDLKKDTLSAIV